MNPDRLVECVDILITEDPDKMKTVSKIIGSKKVRIASIADLIRMKSKTGRKQDEEDIKALRNLQ